MNDCCTNNISIPSVSCNRDLDAWRAEVNAFISRIDERRGPGSLPVRSRSRDALSFRDDTSCNARAF